MDDWQFRLGEKYRVVFSCSGKCVNVFQQRPEFATAEAEESASTDSDETDFEQQQQLQKQQQQRRVCWREDDVYSRRDVLRYWAVAPLCVLVQFRAPRRYLFVSSSTLYDFNSRDGDEIDAFVCDDDSRCPYAVGREWVYALDYHFPTDSAVVARRHAHVASGMVVLRDDPVPMYAFV